MAKKKSKHSRKQRRAAKREAVLRAERVGPTPETMAKLRPCPLRDMLHRGADPNDPGGMQPDQYEAALEIWDAHDCLVKRSKAGTLDMEKVARAHGDIGDRMDHAIAVYLRWGRELPHRFYLTSDIVMGWIDDHDPSKRLINDNQRRMLVRACDLWRKVQEDYEKERRGERERASTS